MTIADEIAALPPIPGPRERYEDYCTGQTITALIVRLALAERLLRDIVRGAIEIEKPGEFRRVAIDPDHFDNARAYLAHREAE